MSPQTITYPDVAAQFLAELYRDVHTGWLQVNHDTKGFDTEWFEPGDFAAMAARACAITSRTGVWVPIATRANRLSGGRGTVADCAEVVALVVDLDVCAPTHKVQNLPPTFVDARARCCRPNALGVWRRELVSPCCRRIVPRC